MKTFVHQVLIRSISRSKKILAIITLSPLLYLNRLMPENLRWKFGSFDSSRIGHLAIGFLIRYAENSLNMLNKRYLYYLPSETSNQFLKVLIKREIAAYRWVMPLIYVSRKMPYLGCLIDESTHQTYQDRKGLTQKAPMPEFTPQENLFCEEWLKSKGWQGHTQKIVCLHVRDSMYLVEATERGSNFWDYHSYRDSHIETYLKTIEWLISPSQSAFVIRTGKSANEQVALSSNYILDYPFCGDQNPLIDVWLFANSDLVLSTGSGPDVISNCYKVPTIYLNLLPLTDSPFWTKSLTASKHLIWENSGKHLDLKEYNNCNFYRTSDYTDYGLLIKDLSEEEILDVVKDGWNYFIRNKRPDQSDINITNVLRELITDHSSNGSSPVDSINKDWIVSSRWIQKSN